MRSCYSLTRYRLAAITSLWSVIVPLVWCLVLLVRVEVEKLNKVQREHELAVPLLEEIIEKKSLDEGHVAISVGSPHWLLRGPHVHNPVIKLINNTLKYYKAKFRPSILVCVLVETFVAEGAFSGSLENKWVFVCVYLWHLYTIFTLLKYLHSFWPRFLL